MALKRSRLGVFAALGLIVLMIVAWFDGGEEEMRTITQTVENPEASQ